VNDILTQGRTAAVIRYKDLETFDEEDEFLKRFYEREEYPKKISLLTEYYKYHKDIARLFMLPTTSSLNKYHDRKRRIEYIRITGMIKAEEMRKKGVKVED